MANPTENLIAKLKEVLLDYSASTGAVVSNIEIDWVDVSTLKDCSDGKKIFVMGDIELRLKG